MKDKEFRINIKIDGKAYPLNIDRIDEEKYRRAAKIVDEKIANFIKKYEGIEKQDAMAMAAFQIALNYTEEQERHDYSKFIDNIKNLNDDIADFLKDKEQK